MGWGNMDKKERQEKLKFLKKRLKRKFVEMAEPMNQLDYTRENYDRLFPDSKISTPIGYVNLGKHQFEKLKENDRENLLGAMYQTLLDPIVVINENDNGKKAQLYSKSFKNAEEKLKGVISVVVDIDGTNVAISTHRRDPNNIINKIKKTADLLYEKQIGDVGTAGTDPYSLNLAISDDTQSLDRTLPTHSNVPQTTTNVNGKNLKS